VQESIFQAKHFPDLVGVTKARQISHFNFQKYEEPRPIFTTTMDMLIYRFKGAKAGIHQFCCKKSAQVKKIIITHCGLHVHPLVEAAI